MTHVEELASFVVKSSYNDLSPAASAQLKIRMLDALGCAIGALGSEPVRMIREQLDDFGSAGQCSLIGGGRSAPDRAALYNGALVRYLDFNDTYMAKGETCHPSDNLGAMLAAAEYANASGRDLLTGLALAYQIQCRLSDVAPVRAKGFDHTVQGAYAVAAGVAKILGLDMPKVANAVAISGTANNALRVTRTGELSHWKGLAYPNMAFAATHAAFLAMRGITGPLEVFEGNKGLFDAITGPFTIDWAKEDLERVTHTIVKRFNAEGHSQATLEGILELREEYAFHGEDVMHVDIETFEVAYHIIGGGEEGDKTDVVTKEQADHSLQYMVAVALLDGQVMPAQYLPDRITRRDVQTLLHQITVRPRADFSERFPKEMPCRITVTLLDGRILVKEKRDYEGFFTRPMRWETLVDKFERLTLPHIDDKLQHDIVDAVTHIETIETRDLMKLLEQARWKPS